MTPALLAALRLGAIAGVAGALAPAQAVLIRRWPDRGDLLARRFHRIARALLGIQLRVTGQPSMRRPTLFCANHASYLDVVLLGSVVATGFVAKSEVASWPVVGSLARLQRTAFVARRRAATGDHIDQLRVRLAHGDNLVLFPEGTSSAGGSVLPFKSSLFAAVEPGCAAGDTMVQPAWIAYRAADGRRLDDSTRATVAWYGDMTLVPHLLRLAGTGGIAAELGFAPAVAARDFPSRKALAEYCHRQVAAGLAAALDGPVWWEPAATPTILAGRGLTRPGPVLSSLK